jgi:predicted DNA-binding transcriptional regulator YafY
MVTAVQSTTSTSVHSAITEIVNVYDLIHRCIATGEPMVVLYNTGDTDAKARVLWPHQLLTNRQGDDYLRAHDSLRDETRSFRVKRILAAHLLQA